ncbi:hypothetical protein RJ641_005621 [Dillenia turbinata]|uniref:Uncharacterized protein n=1 Tax=Dillenia turbinata TaxID=194707 RepID=A0AAN8Z8Z7_9MAGN
MDDPKFWLPSHFLTDDNALIEKEHSNNNITNKNGFNAEIKAKIWLSTEFPRGFDSSNLGSPVESVNGSIDSTETDEEDLLLSNLTHQMSSLLGTSLHNPYKFSSQNLKPKSHEGLVLGSSPQSTLSGLGSWAGSPTAPSQVSSPPTTPPVKDKNDDAWDLIFAAAGQVARMKVYSETLKYNSDVCNSHAHDYERGLLGVPKNPISVTSSPQQHHLKNPHAGIYLTQHQLQHFRENHILKRQKQRETESSVWGGNREVKFGWPSQSQQHQLSQSIGQDVLGFDATGRCLGSCGGGGGGRGGGNNVRPLGLPQSAWPPLQVQHHSQNHHNHNQQQPQNLSNGSGMRAVFLGGSGVRRESTGTGVFLPRRHGTTSSPEPRRKSGCSTVLLPERVVEVLSNMNNARARPFINGGGYPTTTTTEHDVMVARRNALLAQQRQSLRQEIVNQHHHHHEICLPQEWTY